MELPPPLPASMLPKRQRIPDPVPKGSIPARSKPEPQQPVYPGHMASMLRDIEAYDHIYLNLIPGNITLASRVLDHAVHCVKKIQAYASCFKILPSD